MKSGKCYIGTSGWVYQHWQGVFYPEIIAQAKWFEFYAKHFDTVELNSTFYHLPKETTFINWHKRSPKKFIFSLKVSRFITHIKRLKDCKEPTALFLERARLLKAKLGPVLFQLPPRFGFQAKRFENFLELLPALPVPSEAEGSTVEGPKRKRFVFEFRNPAWFDEKIYALLKKKNFAFCQFDMPHLATPEVVTADFVYIRMHGADSLYAGSYSSQRLNQLAKRIKGYLKNGLDTYVYFNNDACGYAVANARQLRETVG